MDDIYEGMQLTFSERLADFVVEEQSKTGRPTKEVWAEVELVASQSQASDS